jgi:ubiquinone biosynthesis protein Coq4
LQKIIDYLSSTPQGKQAFQKRPKLGVMDLQKLHQLPTASVWSKMESIVGEAFGGCS